MNMNRPISKFTAQLLPVVLFALSMNAFSADEMKQAPTEPKPVEVKLDVHMNVPLSPEVANKKLYIELKESPKGQQYFRSQFAARGFTVVDTIEDADVRFGILGAFIVSGKGKQEIRGKLAELTEKALQIPTPDSPDYRHQNIDLAQIGVLTAYRGSISVSDLFIWMSQKTGIAGWFNEMITGDPRGWCLAKSCNEFTNTVYLAIRSEDSGRWWIEATAKDPNMVLDIVFDQTVAAAMKPFDELRSGKH